MISDAYFFVSNWQGEVERARCKHCSFCDRLPDKSGNYTYSFWQSCLKDDKRKFVPLTQFACSSFKPRDSFRLVSFGIQSSLFV